MRAGAPSAVRDAAEKAHAASQPALKASRRSAARNGASLASFSLGLEATVAEALTRASIDPSALTPDMSRDAMALSDPARAAAALYDIVEALRAATVASPALFKAVNALSNLALSPSHLESAVSSRGGVEARRVPYFSLVMEAERSSAAAGDKLGALRDELHAAVGARLVAEQ